MKKDKTLEINDFIKFDFIVDNGTKQIKNTETLDTVLGSNSIIAGFDEKIIGQTIDKKNEIHFNFQLPEDHSFFPGEDVEFTLIILEHIKKFGNIKEENDSNIAPPEPKLSNKILKLKKTISELEKEVSSLQKEMKQKDSDFLEKLKELESKSQNKIIEHQKIESEKTKTEIEENKKFALQKFIDQIIDPLINMEKAICFGSEQAGPEVQAYSKGFTLLINQVFMVLEQNGVQEIIPNPGDEFDPNFHHIMEMVSDTEYEDNKIVELITKGLVLNGRVIKPAIVNVAKK